MSDVLKDFVTLVADFFGHNSLGESGNWPSLIGVFLFVESVYFWQPLSNKFLIKPQVEVVPGGGGTPADNTSVVSEISVMAPSTLMLLGKRQRKTSSVHLCLLSTKWLECLHLCHFLLSPELYHELLMLKYVLQNVLWAIVVTHKYLKQ